MNESYQQHPRRVLYLSHSSALSGAEQYLLALLSALDKEQVDPLVVLPEDGPLKTRIEALAINTRISPMRWWIPATHWSVEDYQTQLTGLKSRVEMLAELISEERIDLVHTNTVVTIEGALASSMVGKPHIWHQRGPFGWGFPPSYYDDVGFFLSVVDLLSDGIIYMSESIRASMQPFCWLAPSWIVYDGLDVEGFTNQSIVSSEIFRARYGIDRSAAVVATIGGIQRRKGQMDLVEAAKVLAQDLPNVVYMLVGSAEPNYLAELRSRIREVGLEENFRLVGFQENIYSILTHVDLVVHPAHSEGFSRALLEAMAAAKPVVATRSGGPEEIVEHGITGFLVESRSPPELAQAIGRLLSDQMLARTMGEAGYKRLASFSLKGTAEHTQAVYRQVLQNERKKAALVYKLRRRLSDFILEEVIARGGMVHNWLTLFRGRKDLLTIPIVQFV